MEEEKERKIKQEALYQQDHEMGDRDVPTGADQEVKREPSELR